jgi:hypothetical protein
VLTYLGLVGLLFMVRILVPVLVAQIKGLINFVAAVANTPEGPTEYLKGLAQLRRSPARSSGAASPPMDRRTRMLRPA